jgi:hypothetical protein
MNNNDPFVLMARTEKAMTKPNLELDMLRNFYACWESLHDIKGDKRNPEIRSQYENAAQALVDAAHPLRALRKDNGN